MKILAVSDVESPYLYEHYRPGRLDPYDLIISCGDLSAHYLEFLVTMGRCPLLYVHGNHDGRFDVRPPEGCVCIEDTVYTYKGVRILGLGGSHRYREGKHQFTEQEMKRRIRRKQYALRKSGGIDVLVTHAPARGINDFDTQAHRGFECFHQLFEQHHPRLFIHGHIHKNYGSKIPQRTEREGMVIINAYDHCEIELDELK